MMSAGQSQADDRRGALLRRWTALLLLVLAPFVAGTARADRSSVIERVKASVVAVGTYDAARTPPFQFLGTGFAVGDGSTIVTNAHVIPTVIEPNGKEVLAILIRGNGTDAQGQPQVMVKEGKALRIDPTSDLAIIKVDGLKLPSLKIASFSTVKEGQEISYTHLTLPTK